VSLIQFRNRLGEPHFLSDLPCKNTHVFSHQVTIYAVADFHRVYSRPWASNAAMGPADPTQPEVWRRFPMLRSAQAWVATLGPGDVLRMPDRCFHRFHYLEPTVRWCGSITQRRERRAREHVYPKPG
jgi:hypothetical protein